MNKILYKYLIFVLLCGATIPMVSQESRDNTKINLKDLENDVAAAQKSNDRKVLAEAYYNLANFQLSNFDQSGDAQKHFIRAREYYSLLDDVEKRSKIDLLIGKLYMKSGFYQEAQESFEKSLAFYSKSADNKTTTHLYYELSKLFALKGDPELELSYLNKAILLNNKVNDSLLLIEFLHQKIKTYEQLSEIDSAVMFTMQAIKLSNKIDDSSSLSKSLYFLARLNKKSRNYKKAIKYYLSSEEFASKKPYNDHRRILYKELGICFKSVNNYREALKYTQKYTKLNDSILNNSRVESITSNAIKYETKERKREIALLEIEKRIAQEKNNQKTNAMYILSGGVFLLLSLLYYIINFYTTRMKAERIINGQKQEISQQKIRELEDNIKISSMQSMLEGQEIERERISKDLHDSLGGLLSTIKLQFDTVKSKISSVSNLQEYKSANKMLDTAVNEVRSISQNLQPGSLMKLGLIPALKDLFNRFDGDTYPEIDFQFYDIPKKIPTMVALSVYRVIQELLNNTIKHAHAKEILIQINTENNELVIQFEDDGIGYDPENLKRVGMGLENIKSRINYLKGQLSVDSEKGDGTSILIHVSYSDLITKAEAEGN
ncbi:MAG: sensor histidine kinase [Saprospiraceae bacterium]